MQRFDQPCSSEGVGSVRWAFLVLIGVQAAHSVEECAFRLYDRLAPARYLSSLVSDDRASGFAIINLGGVGFGLWCWLWPVSRGWRSAKALAWGWAILEIANGAGHLALAAFAHGYFPGLFTAPFLLLASGYLVVQLTRSDRHASRVSAPGDG
jgi:hypothetical protein